VTLEARHGVCLPCVHAQSQSETISSPGRAHEGAAQKLEVFPEQEVNGPIHGATGRVAAVAVRGIPPSVAPGPQQH
jgi:hypothetical protein